MNRLKIFLAAPFSEYLDPRTGLVEAAERKLLSDLKAGFEAQGPSVFLAHEREGWGEDLYPPDRCTRLDYQELKAADLMVALPRRSGGVHIELGWASALSKPIALLLEPGFGYSPLVTGLGEVTRVRSFELDSAGIDQTISQCLEWLAEQPPIYRIATS